RRGRGDGQKGAGGRGAEENRANKARREGPVSHRCQQGRHPEEAEIQNLPTEDRRSEVTRERAMTRIGKSMIGLALMCLLSTAAIPSRACAEDKVNINTASEQELMKLPDVTEARAKGIVSYRKSNGEFIQVDELELIPQVKPIYSKIKDLVAVE